MTLNALERFGFAMAGTLPEMNEMDVKNTQRAALQQLASDPSFVKAPVNDQIARIMQVTGDPSALINENDPLRQAQLSEANANLQNIGLQRARLTALSKMFDGGGDDGTAPTPPPIPASGLASYGKVGGVPVPAITTSASNPLAGPYMPGAKTPAGPPSPGSMGNPASALAAFGRPPQEPPLQSAVQGAVLSPLVAQPPAPAPAAAVQPPEALVAPDSPALKAMKDVVEQSRRAAQIDPMAYGSQYMANKAKLAEMQKTEAENVVTPDNQSLVGQGQKFIDTLPDPRVKNYATSLLAGDQPPPTITSRTPTWMVQGFQAAQSAEPGFSPMTYEVKKQAKLAFGPGGTSSNNQTALNTLINHIGRMEENDKGLPGHDTTALNAVSNYITPGFSPAAATALNDYGIDMKAVSAEGAKASRGVGALTEGELKDNVAGLSPNQAPATRAAARRELLHLAAGKLAALNDQWNSAFPSQPKSFMAPKTIETLKKMGVDPAEFGVKADATGSDKKVLHFDAQGNQIP